MRPLIWLPLIIPALSATLVSDATLVHAQPREVAFAGPAAVAHPTDVAEFARIQPVHSFAGPAAVAHPTEAPPTPRAKLAQTPPPRVPRDGKTLPDKNGAELVLKAAGKYYLDRDLSFRNNGIWIANKNITLNLNGHTISAGNRGNGKSGVRLYLDWADDDRFGRTPEPTGCRIVGPGRIVMGGGAKNHAISGRRGCGVSIEGITCEVSGKDAAAVSFGSHAAKLSDCTLISRITQTANRHSLPAVVDVGGRLVAEQVAILGGQVGFHVGGGSRIRRCFVSTDAFDTNPYAVALYRNNGALVEDCLFLPVSGRGVLLNAGKSHTLRNNVMLAWEYPNKEYGAALNATTLRGRYQGSGHEIVGNHCLAVGGGRRVGASALYLSHAPDARNTITQNRFAAVLVGDPQHLDHYAKALTLEGHGSRAKPARDLISNNIFEGNHWLLSLSGRDGWEKGAFNRPLENNDFRLRDGRAVVDDFLAAAEQKWRDLQLRSPEAAERYSALVGQLRNLDDLDLRPDAAHVWADAAQWHTPAELTITASGPRDDFTLRIQQDPAWPVVVNFAP